MIGGHPTYPTHSIEKGEPCKWFDERRGVCLLDGLPECELCELFESKTRRF